MSSRRLDSTSVSLHHELSSSAVQLALSTWSPWTVPPLPVSNADTLMTQKHVLQVMRYGKFGIHLAPHFCHWPSKTQLEVEKPRVDVEDWLDRFASETHYSRIVADRRNE